MCSVLLIVAPWTVSIPPGSSVHGIFQARILEWVATFYSMGFPRQEYWSGLPLSTPGDLSDPGTEPVSLVSPALAGGFSTTEP